MLNKNSFLHSALLLFICSLSASATIEEESYDRNEVIQILFHAEEHRALFIDEMSKTPKEKLVLFTLGPGGRSEFEDAVKMQKVPKYFLNLTEEFPSISAKIFAIDPTFSSNCNAPEYAFLYENGWEFVSNRDGYPNQPMRFIKNNVEIVFFKFVIPDRYSKELFKAVTNYSSSVLDSGGCLFIAHHGSAFGVFQIFTDAYNLLQKKHPQANNLLMYICCANVPPWSNPKVYHNVSYKKEELDTLYDKLNPFFQMWMPKSEEWEQLSWEQQRQILEEYQEEYSPSYQVYYDLRDLNPRVDASEGTFHLQLSEPIR